MLSPKHIQHFFGSLDVDWRVKEGGDCGIERRRGGEGFEVDAAVSGDVSELSGRPRGEVGSGSIAGGVFAGCWARPSE